MEGVSSDRSRCHWVALPNSWAVAKVTDEDNDEITDEFNVEEVGEMSVYYMSSRAYIVNKSVISLTKV